MFVLVLAAEADETRQAITFLIVCLVGIAALLSALTAWYWQYTSPTRQQANPGSAASDVPPGSAVSPISADQWLEESAIQSAASGAGSASVPVSGRTDEGVPTVEVGGPTVAPSPSDDQPDQTRIEVPDRSAGREPVAARIEVADRCSPGAGSGSTAHSSVRRNGTPPSPAAGPVNGSARHIRNGGDDELTEARRKRERQNEVLSDEEWAAIMKSAFEKMNL